MTRGGRVFVLTGRGDGRFDASWSGAAGENQVHLVIADLDEGGRVDWGGPTSLDSPRAKLRWIPTGFESPREPLLRGSQAQVARRGTRPATWACWRSGSAGGAPAVPLARGLMGTRGSARTCGRTGACRDSTPADWTRRGLLMRPSRRCGRPRPASARPATSAGAPRCRSRSTIR